MIKTKKSEIIIGLVGLLYILSTIPFLLNGADLPTIIRISLVVFPAVVVAGLFLF
jgi:cytochrome c oxidase subunit IV